MQNTQAQQSWTISFDTQEHLHLTYFKSQDWIQSKIKLAAWPNGLFPNVRILSSSEWLYSYRELSNSQYLAEVSGCFSKDSWVNGEALL